MPEQTTGGRISLWGILGCIAFVAAVILMITYDHQKELYLLMTAVLSVFLLMIAFDVGIEPKTAQTVAVAEPAPLPASETVPVEQPVKKSAKTSKKRR
ncbi:MAG TPA: hypothetical protein VFC63_13060 [Blastocatellia bacterium]|nr:hypothetical protein [Blastocatellia bacterium]